MIISLTAKLGDAPPRRLVDSNRRYGVLVDRLKLRVVLYLSFQIHLLEHVQSRLFAAAGGTRPALGLQGTGQVPAALITLEAEGLAVVARSDNLIFRGPYQAHEGQELGGDIDNSPRGLVGATGVDNSDAAVMSSEGKHISAG